MFISGVWRSWFSTIEEVRVVAAFTQLHQNVLQPHFLQFTSTVDNINIPHQDLGVHLTLEFAETNVNFQFLLRFEPFLYFGLQTTQQERP